MNENLNYLKMKAILEQQYYNSLKVFEVTVQLQDPTPPDLRSEADKFSQIEQNRQFFRTKLMTVTNQANSDKIVDDLPLKDIVRVLQGWPIVEKYCKENFVYGIPAVAFMTFIKEKFLPDLSVDTMPNIGNNYLISTISDIIATTPSRQDIANLRKAYQDSFLPEPQNNVSMKLQPL